MFSILVVEDDTILNKMICAKLKQESYKVFTSFDGEQALAILDKEHIDLIISDIMMPNMDGYQLTKELRDASYNIPILMITAKNQFEDMEKAFRAGTDDYMVKPISMRELVLRVKALLRRSQIENQKKYNISSFKASFGFHYNPFCLLWNCILFSIYRLFLLLQRTIYQ